MKKLTILLILLGLVFWLSCQREKNPVTPPVRGNIHPQVDIPWPSLANSPWPMFHHDPQSTGRSPYRGPRKGRIKWTFKPGGTIYSAVVIGPDSTIYFPVTNWNNADSSGLYALSPNGKLKWWFQIPLVSEVQPLVAADGTIFIVGGYHLHLYAINPDGVLKNEFHFSFELLTSMNIGKDGTLYFISDGNLCAVTQMGDLLWKIAGPNAFGPFNNAFSPDGRTLYLFDYRTKYYQISGLYAVGTDGRIKWRYPIEGDQGTMESPLVDSDGTIYFGTTFGTSGLSDGSGFYSISPQGKLNWKYSDVFYVGPTLNDKGYIFVDKSSENYLASFDYQGNLRWQKREEYSLSQIISDNEGIVYFGSKNSVFAYTSDGKMLWRIPFDGSVTRVACPAIGWDGTLYVGTFAGKDSKLYAIE